MKIDLERLSTPALIELINTTITVMRARAYMAGSMETDDKPARKVKKRGPYEGRKKGEDSVPA